MHQKAAPHAFSRGLRSESLVRSESLKFGVVVQKQEDVGAEADLGLGVLAVSAEQGRPLLGTEAYAAGHDSAGVLSGCSIHPLLRCQALYGLQGAI